jgi:uncharacterized protein
MRVLWGLIFLFTLLGPAWAETLPQVKACVKGQCVQADVVITTQEMRKGLQGRDSLAEGQGMIFIFEEDALHRFWMKSMKFPIDIIWMDHAKRIVTIVNSAQPCLQDPCEVYKPLHNSRYVLEVSAGFAAKHQIKEGDVFEF